MKLVTVGFITLAVLLFPQIVVSRNSAIDQAAALDRVLERTTCRVPGLEQKDCDNFGERLLKNKTLFNAFEYARNKEVDIIISTRFYRGVGYVIIEIKAADKQIIDFLIGNRKFAD